MGGRGTQGRVRGIGGGGEGASFSLPHSFRQVQLWTFRRMHGPRSASRNTRGRTAVAVRAVRCARRAHLNAGAPAFEKHANRCIRKACHFAKHAIIEEWMREGKFNGYLTESKASSFEKKIESGITLTRLQMLLAAIMERLWE